ncbi:Pam16-domain-containing protein [Syncephalastrum racemosum]|uniref:Mitochondrial import inner membrane translocase subunit TIM16 n=1 Tax=Syncephalastrum racemosum TaxID=13706 RepID=A0A1X2HAV7_SYNRA|nr:Pam16-domain-containing protein [Syncephalastrum racemosum]
MSGRLIAQIVVSLGTVVGRAFVAAYKQAAANAAQGGGPAARAGAKASAVDALTRKTNMTLEEACQILNVTREADLQQITKNYDHLFNVNDSSKGGSFYLQSKVVRAKERIELERAEEAKKAQKEQTTNSSNEQQTPPPSS